MSLSLVGNTLLRTLITRNLVTFPAQVQPFVTRGGSDLAQRIAQLYFIRGWPLRNICARYGLSKAVAHKLLGDWRIRAIQSGFVQEIEPGCVAAFLSGMTDAGGHDRDEDSTELSGGIPEPVSATVSESAAGSVARRDVRAQAAEMSVHSSTTGDSPTGDGIGTSQSGARLLIVHGDAPVRRTLRSILYNLGFDIFEAGTGEEALALCRYLHWDAVLFDIDLPGKDTPGKSGIETCRELRALKPHVAILAFSDNEDQERNIEVLEAGADDYVTRPLHMGELVARIRAVLRHSRAVALGRREIAGTGLPYLDADKRLVLAAGETVHVMPNESSLIRLSRPRIPADFCHIPAITHPIGETRLTPRFAFLLSATLPLEYQIGARLRAVGSPPAP